jgi:DnaJ-domain-containing protein 1
MSIARRLWRIAQGEVGKFREERSGAPSRGPSHDGGQGFGGDAPGYAGSSYSSSASPASRSQPATPSAAGGVASEDLEYYANLELEPGADFKEIRAAHKRLLRKYHPDLHMAEPDKTALADQIVKRLNRAVEHFQEKHRRGDLK